MLRYIFLILLTSCSTPKPKIIFSRGSREYPKAASKEPLKKSPILSNAFQYWRWPYRYGGNSARGIDCSAFTQRVYQSAGIKLPRRAISQSRVGKKISLKEAKPGDQIFFNSRRGDTITHTGIYLGFKHFIHASSSRGVRINSLTQRYWLRIFRFFVNRTVDN